MLYGECVFAAHERKLDYELEMKLEMSIYFAFVFAIYPELCLFAKCCT